MTTGGGDAGFDVEALADQAVELLAVSAGQVIWIWASSHSLDLIEALACRIRARGAFWTLRLVLEPLLRRLGASAPEAVLGLIPEHELRWLADVDAIVEVHDHGGHVPGVAPARRRALAAEWIALIDAAARRGCRRITIANPTPALAAACGLPVETLRERYRRAVAIDYASLDRQQTRLGAMLGKARTVQISSALGTDLRLRIDGRPVHLDTEGIPRGEVYVAPHEDSADGVAVIDRAFVRGQPVELLRLTFAAGRVVDIAAPDAGGAAALREQLAGASGDKDVIAEFAIGLNPGATEPVGDILLDEKIAGSVHIALGMNEAFGGRNRSNLHLDLVMLRPSVWLDGAMLVKDGVLAAPWGVGERAGRGAADAAAVRSESEP